jgi:hypothetical protein
MLAVDLTARATVDEAGVRSSSNEHRATPRAARSHAPGRR